MGFTDWLAYQVKTFGVGIVSIIVFLGGAGLVMQDQLLIGVIVMALAVVGILWVRYQGREHQIRTEQRKYGRR